MIIERFHPGKITSVYERFDEKGRMMPEGVNYINSWVTEDLNSCYQIMESISEKKIYEWIDQWKDIVDFEVIPVITSAEAKGKVMSGK